MSRTARVTRCTALATTLAAGVLATLAWAAPAQAAEDSGAVTQYGTQDFVWPIAPGIGDGSHAPDDFVWPVAPGGDDGSHAPDDFVWPAPPAAS